MAKPFEECHLNEYGTIHVAQILRLIPLQYSQFNCFMNAAALLCGAAVAATTLVA